MAKKQQKRDNDYYLGRLEAERPDLHREIVSGAMTVTKARQLAGMGGTRTPLNLLKSAWNKASAQERSDFAAWSGLVAKGTPLPPKTAGASPAAAATPRVSTATTSTSPKSGAFDVDGVMLPWARRRIREILDRRGMTAGQMCDELGINRRDASVMMAVSRGTRLKPDTAKRVESWLKRNAAF